MDRVTLFKKTYLKMNFQSYNYPSTQMYTILLIQELVTFKYNDNFTVTFTFLNIDTLVINSYLTYDLGAVLRSPTLNLMFDVFYQLSSQTYHIGITFTKYG